MEEVFNQLISVGVGLCILVGAWFIWLLSGVANWLFSNRKWSWRRTAEDIVKTLVMALAILSWVVLINAVDWYTANLGLDVSPLLDGANVVGLIAIIIGGSANYAFKAFRNFATFIGESHVAEIVGEQNYAKIAEDVKDVVEYWAPPIEPQEASPLSKKEAATAVEDAQLGSHVLLANIIEDLKGYVNKKAFLKEDGSSGKWRGQCTQVPAFVYNQLGVTGSMGNGKDVVANLIARGVAEPCDEEPGAIASADNGTEWGHTWLALGGGYLIEQNVNLGNVKSANFGVGQTYSVRVGRLNEFSRGKITYCRLKGLKTASTVATEQKEAEVPAANKSAQKNTPSDIVEYTYQKGDTFGAVITKLGLKTGHGLWGTDGDVAYYTSQLGITGNIPIGTKLKFKRRTN